MSIWYVLSSCLYAGGLAFPIFGLLVFRRSLRRSVLLVLVGGLAAYAGWVGHPDRPISDLPWAGHLYEELGVALPKCPDVAANAHETFDGGARHQEALSILNACRENALAKKAENVVAADRPDHSEYSRNTGTLTL